jgi:zinc transport system ATP-binding protein
MTSKETISSPLEAPVGASLLAKAPDQPTSVVNETPHSRAGSLPQGVSGPTLNFAEVSLTLGRTTILDKVTFQVQPGSVHALVGPNGGGKSSLIKTLLGQMPHQGQLSLQWPGAPGTIGYVPQALEFDRGLPMTVDDFMAAMCQRRPAFLGLSKRYAAAIGEALERVGMQDKRKRRMGALSGGERQRVLLAQGQVFERLLGDWRAAGITVLWIEHDLEAVGRLADRVTGLNRRVLFDATPQQALTPERLLSLFSTHPRSAA